MAVRTKASGDTDVVTDLDERPFRTVINMKESTNLINAQRHHHGRGKYSWNVFRPDGALYEGDFKNGETIQ
jgi:hypothetical protein